MIDYPCHLPDQTLDAIGHFQKSIPLNLKILTWNKCFACQVLSVKEDTLSGLSWRSNG